ncbi:uncharacterized protein Z519_10150 [Cladophialophora bantiana CBS 173.52]|uniref:p-hydroxylaminobenzoate lyase n=1 Tax=Cladophialophora bantiana (strain ATCC 10958 / CBS 173.52 / CDC B-1940 / NIH 8579) TaxID=1442370 RepID=A0A0D2FRT3_CLAB1|nr:uncharacterized protein Z519_10150 [Cladophialophora bantiana CBS 173.52]KIW89297.1 hypothetical protein Z519_10150 [Cladophialophora bantiana CBS 173.52]
MADAPVLDLEAYPTAKEFVSKCHEFFREVKNLTPGKDLEARLNREYGPGTPFYESFAHYMRQGLKEGWVARDELDGPKYRRGRIAPPTPESNYISITTVYMDSKEVYRGQYHQHPYGEINCVILVDETAELMGMQGWQGAGWTSPGPGTHHYPEVKGGALVALFFLPAGRISYEATPDMPQPASL